MADLRRELGAFRDGDWAREALRVEAAVKDAQVSGCCGWKARERRQ